MVYSFILALVRKVYLLPSHINLRLCKAIYQLGPSVHGAKITQRDLYGNSYPRLTMAYTVRTELFPCPAVLLLAACT